MVNPAAVVEVRQATVSWAALEARCSKYRDGFVKTFLEYKGRPLEDGGTVTRRVFEEHFGIAHNTFGDWLKEAGATRTYTSPESTDSVLSKPNNEPAPVERRLEEAAVKVSPIPEARERTCKHCWVHCPSGRYAEEV